MHRRPRSAFTLIELLVVIAVIAVLAVLFFPLVLPQRRSGLCVAGGGQDGGLESGSPDA